MANSKKQKIQKTRKMRYAVVVFLVASTIIFIGILNSGILNKSYYSMDANKAQEKIEGLMAAMQPDARVLYSSIKDTGCDDNGVGLASYTDCNILAEKYFTTKTNRAELIKQLDEQLEAKGYKVGHYQNDYRLTERRQVAKGIIDGNAPYRNGTPDDIKHEYFVLYVDFLDDDTLFIKNPSVSRLIKEGEIAKPSSDDTIFGMRMEKTYWSCSVKSIIDFCPAAPSDTR